MGITIGDIAKQAGVSKTTVSRVLNNKSDVAPATRERIMRIIEQTDYIPNAVATGLAKGQSRLLGMLVPALSWPWVLAILRGIAEQVERTPYDVILYTLSSHERNEEFFTQTLPNGLVAGLILILPPAGLEHVGKLHRSGFPIVLIDDRGSHPGFPSVGVTDRRGACEATRHFLQLGHRRIGFVNGPPDYGCCRDRLDGYRAALEEAGISFSEELIAEGDFSEAGGAAAIQRWFDAPQFPSAVFVANDLMAFGILRALAQRNVRVPQDVAVVGFDDIPASAYTHPPLTTVRQPMYLMGKTAVEMLLEQVETGTLQQTRVELTTELVVRESCGAQRAGVDQAGQRSGCMLRERT
ncbi:MAG: LacI family DNA-binding transcriptional regulator [Anaerolineae bacterium]